MSTPSPPARVVVLNIGGDGRSGSTILSAILGNYRGVFPVGELRNLWSALRNDELCGCGEPILQCAFWNQVGEGAFGGWERADLDLILRADRRLMLQARLPFLLTSFVRRATRDGVRQYCSALGGVFSAIQTASGCSVIVDSTKHPPYTAILGRIPNLDLRFVQLVRDSRGVAYSEGKHDVVLPEFTRRRGRVLMERSSPWRSGIQWMVKNIAFWALTQGQPRRTVKYEHLMARPADELAAIIQLATGSDGSSPFVGAHPESFESYPFHTVGGNPVRFRRGGIVLKIDDDWRRSMSLSNRAIVSALTFPLLFAYGYIGMKRHGPGATGPPRKMHVPTRDANDK